MRSECDTPSAKYNLAVDYKVMRAVLVVKHFKNGILTSIDTYKKSAGSGFKLYRQYSRQEYIDILSLNDYKFSVNRNELLSGNYSNPEMKNRTEDFIRGATTIPFLYRCENRDFLKDFEEH